MALVLPALLLLCSSRRRSAGGEAEVLIGPDLVVIVFCRMLATRSCLLSFDDSLTGRESIDGGLRFAWSAPITSELRPQLPLAPVSPCWARRREVVDSVRGQP